MVIPTRLRLVAGAVVICGGLGAAAVNGVFAAPSSETSAALPAAVGTPAAGTPAATPGTAPTGQPGTKPAGRGHFPGGGSFASQPLADFFGISLSDLQTAFQNRQTLAQIAQAHGKSTADLKAFLTSQEKSQLDQAVQAGKLTSDQETTILNGLSSKLDNVINGTFPSRGPAGSKPGGPDGFRGHGGFGHESQVFSQAATFLGITQSDLQTALKNGQTLAQVAQAHGKTAADLKAYLLSQESTRIDQLLNQNFQQLRSPGTPGATKPAATPTATQ